MQIKKHIELLGLKVEDRVTGFKGVVSSVGFDLYGCVQAIVTPTVEKGGTDLKDSRWFDVTRLKVFPKRRSWSVRTSTLDRKPKGNKDRLRSQRSTSTNTFRGAMNQNTLTPPLLPVASPSRANGRGRQQAGGVSR